VPSGAEKPRDLVRGRATACKKGRLGVVADLHLCEDQGQDLGAKVDLASSLPRCLTALDRPDRFLGADDGLEFVALVHGCDGLRAVRKSAAGEQPESWLIARAQIAQPVTALGERAASSDREGYYDVGRDQSHTLDTDRGAARDGLGIAIDRYGLGISAALASGSTLPV